MIQRPIWTLPISDTLLNKLKDAGFEYYEDIINEKNEEELERILPGTKLNFKQLHSMPLTKTALEMYLEDVDQNDNIITFSKGIDDLFEGGIPSGRITELLGAPGSGKTQVCLQLCVSVQIPVFLGGLNGSAIYIETNSNFSVKRIKEIHSSCSSHCTEISKDIPSSSKNEQYLQDFVRGNPLERITKFSAGNIEELRASVFMVQSMLENKLNDIKLIIVDSFTFPFYTCEADLERTKIITETLILLHQLAQTHHLVVIVTNELTTCILDNGTTEITPSLGESFAHIVHNRLVLGKNRRNNLNTAILHKSSEFPSDSAYFQINEGGIRDVEVDE